MRPFSIPCVLALVVLAPADRVDAGAAPDPAKTYSEGEAIRVGWPALAGPYGNFQPLRTDERIVEDLTNVKVAWESACADLGIAKQGTPFGKSFQSGKAVTKYLGAHAGRHPGNWAGAIVAEGKVFVSSFRPVGPGVACVFPDGVAAEVRVDAEDFVVAMDFHTGKTLWLSAEPGGMLVGGGKRQGFQVAPVYAAGKVFALGSTGRLFAYDAATGKRLWATDIGASFQKQDALRTQILASLARGTFQYAQNPAWHTSLTVADGTLIVPTFTGGTLRGVDPATGKTRWEAKGVGSHLATPSVYRSGGREYVLTANPAGEMRLLDPKDGQELWKVTGLGPAYFTLAPSATHVLVNVNPKSGGRGVGRIPGYYGAYRISPAKAELAWKMAEGPGNGFAVWMDSAARYRYTIRAGLVYLETEGLKAGAPGRFLVLKEDTGAVVAGHPNAGGEADRIAGLWYLIGDKILCRANNSHGPTHGGRHPWVLWRITGDQITRLPGTLDQNEFTNGYEVNMEYPVVAGRLFERNEAGKLVCYDLRQRGR